MDTGWVIYGILLIVGAFLVFDPRNGIRPVIIVILAVLSGVGVSLVGIFQGSNANVENRLITFHTLGAQGVMLAGNLMAIAVGAGGPRIGLCRGRSIATIALGTVGLIAFPLFMADGFTGFLRGCPGLQAREESVSCGAGQGQPDRRQCDPVSTPHGGDVAYDDRELSTVSALG
jgi:hypothetical protein